MVKNEAGEILKTAELTLINRTTGKQVDQWGWTVSMQTGKYQFPMSYPAGQYRIDGILANPDGTKYTCSTEVDIVNSDVVKDLTMVKMCDEREIKW